MDTTLCKASGCKYNNGGSCSLDVKASCDVVEEPCIPTNNWYIVGSFVLDHIFDKNTANDIDLVMPEGEMPADLPSEIVQAGLPIEMIWRRPADKRGFDFLNISLPRIGPGGLLNWEVAEFLKESRLIITLPEIRKVPALTIFIAVKSMAKYDLHLDKKTLKIWAGSITSPLGWKEEYRFLTWQGWVKKINWDYLKAEYLVCGVQKAYRKAADHEREIYLERLQDILMKLELGHDIGYQFLLRYVSADIKGNTKEKEELEQVIRVRRMKIR